MLHLKLNLFFSLLRSKNWRESKIKYFSLVQIKNSFARFWKKRKYRVLYKINIIRKVSANLPKNINFQGPCNFFKFENFAEVADFWNWTPKNISDRQKCVGFQKSERIAKSLHPTVQRFLPAVKRRVYYWYQRIIFGSILDLVVFINK